MIVSLRGIIKDIGESTVTLEVAGLGYEVYLTDRAMNSLRKKMHEEIELYTHHHVRENFIELYGFLKKEEKNMFRILIGISGVGPKGALHILNAAPLDILQRAIAEGDTSVLTKVSGIGNRIAQKIILELKDKFARQWSELPGDIRKETDVVEALQSLGYSMMQAQNVLSKLPKDLETTEEKLKEALKILGRGSDRSS